MDTKRRSFWRELWSAWRVELPRTLAVIAAVAVGVGIVVPLLGVYRLLGISDLFGGGLAIATVFLGAGTSYLILAYLAYLGSRQPSAGPSLQARLQTLNRSINEAVDFAAEIESELRVRQRAFEELSAKSAQAEELAKLDQEAAQAIAALVEGAVQRQGRRDRIVNNAVGFLIGVVTTVLGLVLSNVVGHGR